MRGRALLKPYSLVASALCACAPTPVAAPSVATPATPMDSPPPAPIARVGISATRWERVVSRRFSLSVPLPERSAWRVDDASTPWFVARHAPSDSQLLARTWAAPRLVRPSECEQQARLWRPDLPAPSPDTEVDRRVLHVPDGFQTDLIVAVQAGKTGIEGFVLGFGAAIGRCYAVVYTTSAQGRDAQGAVGRRLAIAVDGVVARIGLLSIEDRVAP